MGTDDFVIAVDKSLKEMAPDRGGGLSVDKLEATGLIGLMKVDSNWSPNERAATLFVLILDVIDTYHFKEEDNVWALRATLRLPAGPRLGAEYEQWADELNEIEQRKARFVAFRKLWNERQPERPPSDSDHATNRAMISLWNRLREKIAPAIAREIRSRNERQTWQKPLESVTTSPVSIVELTGADDVAPKRLEVPPAIKSDPASDSLSQDAVDPHHSDNSALGQSSSTDESSDEREMESFAAPIFRATVLLAVYIVIAWANVTKLMVEWVYPPARKWRVCRWVEDLTSELMPEPPLDDALDKEPIIFWRFLAIPPLAVSINLAAARVGPAFTWSAFKWLDQVLQNFDYELLAFLVIMGIWPAIWLGALIVSESDAVRWRITAVFLVLALTPVVARADNYYSDKQISYEIAHLKPKGSVLETQDFAQKTSCPKLGSRPGLFDLSSCTSVDGSLNAELDAPRRAGIGLYPSTGTSTRISPRATDRASVYYVDIRFRASLGSISACGVEVESNKGILLSRVLWDAGRQQYVADISSVRVTSDPSQGVSLVSLARSTDLPFVNKWTITDRSYATWTRLTVTVETSDIDVIVDDRLALSFPYIGISDISRGTIAVAAGSAGRGGVASCIFDHEEVGVFPRDGGSD